MNSSPKPKRSLQKLQELLLTSQAKNPVDNIDLQRKEQLLERINNLGGNNDALRANAHNAGTKADLDTIEKIVIRKESGQPQPSLSDLQKKLNPES